jgi:glycerol uptake facilitator-like aquaporin
VTQPSLASRATAEFVGTAFLTMAVIGSGIAAQRLSPGDLGLQLLENSIATGAVLVALILTFQSVSAAFNPLITLLDWLSERTPPAHTVALVVAQVVGALVGAVIANVMFGLDAVSVSARDRSGAGLWLAETVATVGLLTVVFGCVRSGRSHALAYAVGGYIAAAYWFTSSTSFANPALTLARMLSDTFAGVAPSSVPGFLLAEAFGAALVVGLIALIWPRSIEPSRSVVGSGHVASTRDF